MENEVPDSEIRVRAASGDASLKRLQTRQRGDEQAEDGQHCDFPHEEVVRLLRVGTAGEVVQRAQTARGSLSGQKAQLARHAHEALQIIEQGGYRPLPEVEWIEIQGQVCEAVARSTYYCSKDWRPAPEAVGSCGRFETVIEVQNSTTLAAVQALGSHSAAEGKLAPGALNFASARNPGGGFTTGAQAQEESLARSSAIYPCLTRHFESFFVPNRKAPSGAYTHDIIFSPGVPVFRDDTGALLEQPYMVDFLTAAAPNAGTMKRNVRKSGRKGADASAAGPTEVLRERIPRVLDVFARNGVVDLVLGAWGCGVFENDPAVVARIFHENLRGRFQGRFRHVIFAVLDTSMAQVFATEFASALVPPASEGSKAGAKRRWGSKKSGNVAKELAPGGTAECAAGT